jgi:hypothetical protein
VLNAGLREERRARGADQIHQNPDHEHRSKREETGF